MKNIYKIYTKENNGRQGESAGKFASVGNAKKALKKYSRIFAHGGSEIVAWQIQDTQTGEIVEHYGIM